MTHRRVTVGEPVPGFLEGRPVEPRPGDTEASRAMRQAWAACFMADSDNPHAAGQTVLADLARYCGADTTTAKADPSGRSDPIASAVSEGRRQVWLLIAKRLGLHPKGY